MSECSMRRTIHKKMRRFDESTDEVIEKKILMK
jgi:hypothetical protein